MEICKKSELTNYKHYRSRMSEIRSLEDGRILCESYIKNFNRIARAT